MKSDHKLSAIYMYLEVNCCRDNCFLTFINMEVLKYIMQHLALSTDMRIAKRLLSPINATRMFIVPLPAGGHAQTTIAKILRTWSMRHIA